jgi:D-sedoheptulose 7-phosphate isomerase
MYKTIFEKKFSVLQEAMNTAEEIHFESAEKCIQLTQKAFKNGKKLLLCGNGGSASTASHITNDFIGHMNNWDRVGFPSIALNTDVSVLTALSNDFGYDHVFSKQVQALGQKDDVLWVFSVSANSSNIIRAVREAKKIGMKTVLFTKKGGGKLSSMVDLSVEVNTNDFMTAEALHLFYVHSIAESIEANLTPEKNKGDSKCIEH